MPIELSHLMQLAAGQKPALEVGNLPRPVAEYLRCHPAVVYLGSREFYKIVGKHTEIGIEQLQLIYHLVAHGAYYEDDKRPRCVTVFSPLPTEPKLFVAGLKAAAKGAEVWVQTFHRIDDHRAEAKQRSARLIFDATRR